jgi:DegV family protein with EDD domain
MGSVAIVTDSTAYLPPELVEKHNITVVPLYVRFGEEVFKDGVDMTTQQFYNRLPTSPIFPATSQPSPADFIEAYRRRIEEGATEILSIHLSSKLSGTISSVLLAKEEIQDVPIHVVDSFSISVGLGHMVLVAARALEASRPVEEIVKELESLRDTIRILFVVDTLEYLHKGGRIGGAQVFLGSLLNLKPLLGVKEGRVEAIERVRTKRRAVRRMLDLFHEEFGDKPVHCAVIHASVPAEANLLAQKIQQRFNCSEALVSELSPVVGTHAGPGTVGMMMCPAGED